MYQRHPGPSAHCLQLYAEMEKPYCNVPPDFFTPFSWHLGYLPFLSSGLTGLQGMAGLHQAAGSRAIGNNTQVPVGACALGLWACMPMPPQEGNGGSMTQPMRKGVAW